MSAEVAPGRTYGILAQFLSPHDLLRASQTTYGSGYRYVEAYSPFPIEGLAEGIGFPKNRMPLIIFLGGLFGGLSGFFMQWYTAVVEYPFDVAGKPYNSWPSFIPITFEMTILFASFAGIFGMLWLNGLPMPYHPCFNVPEFELASRNRFFLFIRHDDPMFDPEATRKFLEGLGPKTISLVPR